MVGERVVPSVTSSRDRGDGSPTTGDARGDGTYTQPVKHTQMPTHGGRFSFPIGLFGLLERQRAKPCVTRDQQRRNGMVPVVTGALFASSTGLVVLLPLLVISGLGWLQWMRRRCCLELSAEVVTCLEDHGEITYWRDDLSLHGWSPIGGPKDVLCVVVDPYFEDGLWESLVERLVRRGTVVLQMGVTDCVVVRWAHLLFRRWAARVEVLCFHQYEDMLVCHR